MNKCHCWCPMQGGGQGEHTARNRQHGQKHRRDKEEQKKCTHCGKYMFHKPSDCYKLKANTSKRWMGWKSIKDAGVASA